MKTLYSNVDSLVSELSELRDAIQDNKPQVVWFTET